MSLSHPGHRQVLSVVAVLAMMATGASAQSRRAPVSSEVSDLWLNRDTDDLSDIQRRVESYFEGKYKGRQPLKAEKVEKLKSLVEAGSSISAAAREVRISRVTAHKYLKEL